MKDRKPTIHRAVLVALGATVLSASLPIVTASAADSEDDTLAEVIITGSRIMRTDAETPSPVQIITREDIERSGKQNISDIIRSVSADNQGSLPTAFSGGFASGAAGVSLRGLGLNSTLVLVNGRRMAPYGLADDGARTFVDLNTIPMEAVERVDVLKDGASAIYGSDAVGGVINIILRETYEGVAISGNTGTSYKQDGSQYRFSASAGQGSLASDRYNVYFTAEITHDNAIKNSNRSKWLGTSDLTPYGFWDLRQGAPNTFWYGLYDSTHSAFSGVTPYGSVRVPGGEAWERTNLTSCPQVSSSTGVCLYDMTGYNEIQPDQGRINLYGHGAFQFSDSAQGYVELGWFNSKVSAVGTPGGVNDSGVFNPSDPLNPVTAPHTTILPAGHPDNPYGEDRTLSLLTTMLGGRNSNTDSAVTRAIAGLKGNISSWNYDLAVGYIHSKLNQEQTGFVYWPALQDALDAGTFRVDGSLNSAAVLAAISPTLVSESTSSVTLAEATLSRDLFMLPGGALGFAGGLEFRREKSNSPPIPYTDTGDIVGLGYSAYSGDRKVTAAYVELEAPIAKQLVLNGAFRYDHYSDYGNSTTPKFGVKWTPIPQLAIRGTYSEAFRAPGPTESGNSATLGYTNIAIITIGDPSVQPETAKSYTAGIVFEPIDGSSISLDYYRIVRDNEITQADQAAIVGGASTSCASVPGTPCANTVVAGAQPNSFLYYDEFGDLATISGPYANANKTTTTGIDADLRQTFTLNGGDKLEASLLWTHVFKFEKVLADGTKYEYAGTQGPYSLSSASGTPKDRAALALTWTHAQWSLTGRVNYVGSMKMIDHQDEELVDYGDGTYSTTTGEYVNFVADPDGIVCAVYYPDGRPFNGDCETGSFTTADLSGRVTINEQLELNGSITNVFNTIAPFNPYTYGAHNYNSAYAQSGAIGRYFNVGFRYKF